MKSLKLFLSSFILTSFVGSAAASLYSQSYAKIFDTEAEATQFCSITHIYCSSIELSSFGVGYTVIYNRELPPHPDPSKPGQGE